MLKRAIQLIGFVALLVAATGQVQAAVIFYTDRTTWESDVTGRTDVDFEGITSNTTHIDFGPDEIIGGIKFSAQTGTLGVSGKDDTIQGAPFDSAILFANYSNASITADLSTAGPNFTAVGGFFGEINSAGTVTTITLTGTSGVLDSRTLVAADMGRGTPSNFFGWVVSGDTIVSVKHDIPGSWEGIDNFSYGYSVVPEPSTFLLFGVGIVGLSGYARCRGQTSTAAQDTARA